MKLSEAKNIADILVAELTPYCELINIAGSVRRKAEDVGDIEIVCIPQITIREDKDLFGGITSTTRVIHPEFERIIKDSGKVIKGHVTGRLMQIETPHSIMLDLFMPQANDYYRQLAIRTGSAEYAKRYIASQWVKKGWCGTKDGLRRQVECYKINDKQWEIQKEFIKKPSIPPVWKNEAEFFTWLGVQYMSPEYRNL